MPATGELTSNARPGASIKASPRCTTYRGVSYTSERHIVVNRTSLLLQVLWNTGSKDPVLQTTVPPHGNTEIGTYAFHQWTLQAEDGSFGIQWSGSASIIEVQPSKICKITRTADVEAAATRGTHPAWGKWQQRGCVVGLPIMAYDCVCQEAVEAASKLAARMLQHCPASVVTALQEAGAQLGIIGKGQLVTDMPTHGYLRHCSNRDMDSTCRGLGGTRSNPVTTAAEENILMQPGDMFCSMSVLVHELGHAVMNIAVPDDTLGRIYSAYCAAKAAGTYPDGCYMMVNEQEYWAAAVEAWFESTVRVEPNAGLNSREGLVRRDPGLAGIVREVFGDGQWRFHHDCPGKLHRRRDRGREARAGEGEGGGSGEGGGAGGSGRGSGPAGSEEASGGTHAGGSGMTGSAGSAAAAGSSAAGSRAGGAGGGGVHCAAGGDALMSDVQAAVADSSTADGVARAAARGVEDDEMRLSLPCSAAAGSSNGTPVPGALAGADSRMAAGV